MVQAVVITPVKNSLQTTEQTIQAIADSIVATDYTVYNDFSNEETTNRLKELAEPGDFRLINLEDITNTPSPNYKLVLQMAQKEANKKRLPLIVVESDVKIYANTFSLLLDFYRKNPDAGLIGAVTTDQEGKVNFPYLKFKEERKPFIETTRSLSFCCTLFSERFLLQYDFTALNEAKDWYDTFISYKSVELGLKNYLLLNVPVLHTPHASRPWKQLKYSNPIKYYFLKLLKKRDKI